MTKEILNTEHVNDFRKRVKDFIELNSHKRDDTYDDILYFIGRNIKMNILLSSLLCDIKSTLISINRELNIAESLNYSNSKYSIGEIKELHELSLNMTDEYYRTQQ